MYEAFFGLRERPFDLVPNPRFLFLTARQREALSNLRYGLTTPRGLTLLLGEAGTGKTTRARRRRSARSTGRELDRPAQQPDADAAGVLRVPGARLRPARRSCVDRRRAFCSSCGASCRSGTRPACSDGADHRRSAEPALRAARGSPAAQQHRDDRPTKLLNVVLAGQPELADRLNEQSLRQLKQRISLRCAAEAAGPAARRRPTSPAGCASPAASGADLHPRSGRRPSTRRRRACRARST